MLLHNLDAPNANVIDRTKYNSSANAEKKAKKFLIHFLAGVTVAYVLIPQTMAYALLAGLPAAYGLYSAFITDMVASLFGCSFHFATGAIVSLAVAATFETLATAGIIEFIAYSITLPVVVGIVQFALWRLRTRRIMNFLSNSIVNGLTIATAIILTRSNFLIYIGYYMDNML